MRVINMGFFYIDDDYVVALEKHPLLEGMDVNSMRRKTYLPRITDSMNEEEVKTSVNAAIIVASPKEGDAILVSGTADVVAYVVDQLRDSGVTLLCPIGKYRDGRFHLQCLRRIVL